MPAPTVTKDLLTGSIQSARGELVTSDGFAELLQVSKRTLFRLRAKGVLPAPVEISTNIIRWRSEDVQAYLNGLQPRKARARRGN
jgi:predicted DNA-binding transcriptional regulator AlpA